MAHLVEHDMSDDHPLALEISSLRHSVARFQQEAHASSVKLQRHSLDTSNAHERMVYLERENALLRSELAVLRANPPPDGPSQSHPASVQVQELTLSLRRLNDKLTLTEEALLTRTTKLAHALSRANKARHAEEGAYELAARTRGREEEGKMRERELERRVRASEEERKMTDLVVIEYADLVRSLEGRPGSTFVRAHSRSTSSVMDESVSDATTSSDGSATLVDSLSQGKFGLQKLLSEFSHESERLEAELAHSQTQLDLSEAKREAEAKEAENSRIELAKAKSELERLRLNDNTAAKMVSRYMKFSQSSTDALQVALTSLKTRHEATLSTLTTQLQYFSDQLAASQRSTEKLRDALDELSADIARETYGRRREVASRIAMVGREERFREGLQRWLRKAVELLGREGDPELAHGDQGEAPRLRVAYEKIIQEVQDLLLSGGPSESSSDSLARVIAAQSAVDMLVEELQAETERRLQLERIVAFGMHGAHEEDVIKNRKEDIFTEGSLSPHGKDLTSNGLSRSPSDETMVAESIPQETSTISPLETIPKVLSFDDDSSNVPSKPREDLDIKEAVVLDSSVPEAEEPPRKISISSPPTITQLEIPLPMDADDNLPVHYIELPEPAVTAPETSPRMVTDGELSTLHMSSEASHFETLDVSSVNSLDIELVTTPLSSTPLFISDMIPETTASPTTPLAELESKPSFDLAPDIQHPQIVIASIDVLQPSPRVPSDLTLFHESQVPYPTVLEDVAFPVDSQDDSSQLNSAVDQPPITVPPHPLLNELARVKHRYDDLQRAFRDCHLTLQDLKNSISSPPSVSDNSFKLSSASVSMPSFVGSTASGIPSTVLQAVLERLNDYTEDVRVELEIRAADEALLARGFETLLAVPGALSPSHADQPLPTTTDERSEPNLAGSLEEIELQIVAFTSGSDKNVQRAFDSFSRKLGDIQHDIAALKHAVHNPEPSLSSPATPPPPLLSSSSSSGWSSWIRGSPSRSANPLPSSGTTPTFGTVMTSPSLRHSPSLNLQGSTRKRPEDSLTKLGLRVPMPNIVHVAPPRESPRPRTLSAMYMFGLGARGTGSLVPPSPPTRTPVKKIELDEETDLDESEDDVE